MLNFSTNLLKIPLFIFLFVLNTAFHGTLVGLCAPIKFIIPLSDWRLFWGRVSYWISGGFIKTNSLLLKVFYQLEWSAEGLDTINSEGSYLVISNHLSLLDIPVVQGLFLRQIPFLLFFIKQELLWVPFLGQALWALEYPTMKRYSKETLKKHPELRGKDLETAKRSCENLKGHPVTILNYAEGTRFTFEKHAKTKSPYQHLLKPRAGGIHTVLSSMGDEMTAILNVTLVYPGHSSPNFTDLLFGRVKKIVVCVEALKFGEGKTPALETIRAKGGSLAVRNFLNELWKDKDKHIGEIHLNAETKAETTQPTSEPFSTESVGVSNTTPLTSE
ncbi:MAG: 1-acyl-sn-glycerol-3-phosphate acyltransferase [SAR324 cluster bacterium]|nr:1-acyl-sn-glycerol-3-phosphate acyltransferase [SAR324 cluster bacterium]MBL7035173.1 1-acyl-sn-glycerol-3-phosphate acyltransferase [SAR324 cluster bacterium]